MPNWRNTKEDIFFLKIGNQTVLFPVDFHCMDKNMMEGNGNWNSLVTNILQNIFFCVPQNKDMHTGFGTAWGWVNDDRILILVVN